MKHPGDEQTDLFSCCPGSRLAGWNSHTGVVRGHKGTLFFGPPRCLETSMNCLWVLSLWMLKVKVLFCRCAHERFPHFHLLRRWRPAVCRTSRLWMGRLTGPPANCRKAVLTTHLNSYTSDFCDLTTDALNSNTYHFKMPNLNMSSKSNPDVHPDISRHTLIFHDLSLTSKRIEIWKRHFW